MEGFRSDWIVVSWIRWLWDGGHEFGDGSFGRSDSEACSEMPTSEPIPAVSSLSMRCTVAASAENDNAPTDHFWQDSLSEFPSRFDAGDLVP